MKVRNLRWRDERVNLTIERSNGATRVVMSPAARGIDVGSVPSTTATQPVTPLRLEYQPLHPSLRGGQASQRLRILEVHRSRDGDRVRYEVRTGSVESVAAVGPAPEVAVDGATIASREPGRIVLRVAPAAGAGEWVRGEFTVHPAPARR
jgi:hypothetical protein